ncbi:MAG: M23 family metallopeptidase [Firmicutes bacterium]|nr:M23 family metallopeptidase [Bacillota bacterium]
MRALRAGTVRRVGSGDPDRREGGRNLGQFVEIDHGGGVLSRYAPLTDLKVKVGDRVEAGAVIGQVAPPPPAEPGAPHLHLEVHASGGSVDPKPFLDEGGGI